MLIRFIASGSCSRGLFNEGDIKDWPLKAAQQAIDQGIAEPVKHKPQELTRKPKASISMRVTRKED